MAQAKLILSLWCAFAFLCGQSIRIDTSLVDDFFTPLHDLSQAVLHADDGLTKVMEAAPPAAGKEIPQERRAEWTVECNSAEPDSPCINAIRGLPKTFWQTKLGTLDSQNPAELPHSITIDLRRVENVNGIRMTPRPDAATGGAITAHKVYLSLDNRAWGAPVAFGTWFGNEQNKYAVFEPQQAQFVRLVAITATMNTQFVSIANLSVWSTDSFALPAPALGRWGPTVNFPLVPVGVFLDPPSGRLITFSSYLHDDFSQDRTNKTTLTATWDPTTHAVSQRRVQETGHDMFCPGMAFDVNGRMVITGGETSYATSIYDPVDDTWKKAKAMQLQRGYQGSTTCADGRIFVIGGSWSPDGTDPPRGGRTGEIYDPAVPVEQAKWTLLNGCPADPIETTEDCEGKYRADNHVWLLGWKNNSVFHAGPSKNMHWITTTGSGAISDSFLRKTDKLSDRDAICGSAAMYDAVAGKILTVGGAPQYKYANYKCKPKTSPASNNSFIITLGEVNQKPSVDIAGGGMKYARIFHHAVILPNGETFVAGGQVQGTPFWENLPQLTPEIYSPAQNSWREGAPNTIVRVYHSFGLLLRDATVLVGGGGLCGACNGKPANHFDAQIYTPSYLLTPNGDAARRPTITKTSAARVLPGASLNITTDSNVVAASLVRYGAATHSLNNDQRRVELKLQTTGTAFQYITSIPSDGGVVIPGYYMLFVLNSLGVPSVATNVQILVAGTK